MAETASNMIALGTFAPSFTLLDTLTHKTLSLAELKSNFATVIMFLCNHCPYVKHIQQKLVEIAKLYQAKGVSFIAINANDIKQYPQDDPDHMRQVAQTYGYSFPYLFDETQEVAKAYQAACTPDFYVFDGDLACVYRGRFDGSTPGNQKPVTGEDLQAALDSVLANKPAPTPQFPSLGCNIKWKK